MSETTVRCSIVSLQLSHFPNMYILAVTIHHGLYMRLLFFMMHIWHYYDVIVSSFLSQLHFTPL